MVSLTKSETVQACAVAMAGLRARREAVQDSGKSVQLNPWRREAAYRPLVVTK